MSEFYSKIVSSNENRKNLLASCYYSSLHGEQNNFNIGLENNKVGRLLEMIPLFKNQRVIVWNNSKVAVFKVKNDRYSKDKWEKRFYNTYDTELLYGPFSIGKISTMSKATRIDFFNDLKHDYTQEPDEHFQAHLVEWYTDIEKYHLERARQIRVERRRRERERAERIRKRERRNRRRAARNRNRVNISVSVSVSVTVNISVKQRLDRKLNRLLRKKY